MYIDSESALKSFFAALPPEQPVAIDTEFDSARTFYPVLALIQVGIGKGRSAIIDPLSIEDLSPLSEMLADPARRKFFFSGANDLPLLFRRGGGALPRNVFDVQTACAFYGKSPSLSLKTVVEEELGIVLDKSETLSDWLLRPLTESQLKYAAGDVELLPQIAAAQEARLRGNGNWEFFIEEMQQYESAQFYRETPVEEAWRKVRGLHSLRDSAERGRAQTLACWREKTARTLDLPRNRILRDEQLIWLALHNPRSLEGMRNMPRLHHGTLRQFGDGMLRALADSAPSVEAAAAENTASFTPAFKERHSQYTQRVMRLAAKRAEERQIDHTLLATRHNIESYVFHRLMHLPTEGMRITAGWRARLLQPTLSEII